MEVESKNQIRCPEIIESVGTLRPDYKRLNESDSFKYKHDTLKSKVLQLLKQDKYARKDDFYLCLLTWIKSGHIKLIIPLEDFNKIYKPESISRCRRRLIEEAKKGNKELKFLLKDTETMELRENYKNLYHDYYQDKKIESDVQWIK